MQVGYDGLSSTRDGAAVSRIFKPHIHTTSHTTDDYEARRGVGVRALVAPTFRLGQA